MANPEHLKILKQGVDVWNRWRGENPEVSPDLNGEDLSGADLRGFNFQGINLMESVLRSADLRGANFAAADLREADLSGANLSFAVLGGSTGGTDPGLGRAILVGATLESAVLIGTDLRYLGFDDVDLTGVILGATNFSNTHLKEARGLESAKHQYPSKVDVSTLSYAQGKLPESFLRGCGLSAWEIAAAKLYDPDLTPRHVHGLTGRVARLRTDRGFYSCFISYSHTDKAFAHELHGRLQASGIVCWLDEHDLKPGDRILDIVNDAIRLHDKILLCCSESSLNSWWVKDEIEKALERERSEGRDIIIPLNLDGYLLEGWVSGQASTIRARLAADFTGWEHDNAKFEEQFERVVKALKMDEGSREYTSE